MRRDGGLEVGGDPGGSGCMTCDKGMGWWVAREGPLKELCPPGSTPLHPCTWPGARRDQFDSENHTQWGISILEKYMDSVTQSHSGPFEEIPT